MALVVANDNCGARRKLRPRPKKRWTFGLRGPGGPQLLAESGPLSVAVGSHGAALGFDAQEAGEDSR